MKIIVDAMGGDNAPAAAVAGAVRAVREYGVEVVLVGDEARVAPELDRLATNGLPVHVAHAGDVIGPEETPVAAVRQKPDSSLVRGLRLLREGGGDGFVSAGSTGALMAGGLLILGRAPGIDRPAIGTFFPTKHGGRCLVLDMGAVVDARPENLLQFAIMGAVYVSRVGGGDRPRVGLLNVGTEEAKGNELTKRTYSMLASSALNFVGNVEARDIVLGVADVIVCDGFVGNVLLKTAEGIADEIFSFIRDALGRSIRSRAGALLARPALRSVKANLDYTEHGGAPLLGLKGIVIKCHGSSNARAMMHGVRVAKGLAEGSLVEKIQQSLGSLEVSR